MSTLIIFIVVIIALVSFFIINSIMFHLQWKQVYTAIGHKQYYNYVNKLKAKKTAYRTKTPVGARRNGVGAPSYDATQYNIYVKKKDVHKISGNIEK